MFPFITLGPFAIPSKPFVFIIGIYTALWLVDLVLDQIDAEPEWVRSSTFNAIILGLIGGRIVFALTHLPATMANPVSIIWPITIGYSLWGSVFFGFLALIYFARQEKVSQLKLIDALLQPILVLLAAWVLADFLGGPGYGSPANLGSLPTHPVQIYEMIVLVGAFFVLRAARPHLQFDGWLSLVGASFLSAGFLITLNFRGGSATIFNGWQVNQLVAFASLTVTLALLAYRSPSYPNESLTSN